MTEVAFYHGAADKLSAAGRIVAELVRAGRRVVVYAPDSSLARRFDHLLWTQPATGFVPHVAASHPLAGETPVVLAASLDERPEDDDVLLNLDGELPGGFARFRQLVEVVGVDDDDRLPARERYKFYRDRGYALATHDLAGG